MKKKKSSRETLHCIAQCVQIVKQMHTKNTKKLNKKNIKKKKFHVSPCMCDV